MGDVNRVLAGGRQSAEAAQAGRVGTSDPKNSAGQRVRLGKGNRTDGRSHVKRHLTDSEVGEESHDLRSADASGDSRAASGKACKARKPEPPQDRVGS